MGITADSSIPVISKRCAIGLLHEAPIADAHFAVSSHLALVAIEKESNRRESRSAASRDSESVKRCARRQCTYNNIVRHLIDKLLIDDMIWWDALTAHLVEDGFNAWSVTESSIAKFRPIIKSTEFRTVGAIRHQLGRNIYHTVTYGQ